jgi:SAM-dependent methyltransferase
MSGVDRDYYEQAELWGASNITNPEHQLERLEVIDRLLPEDTASVVDVGAGDGRVLHHLRGKRQLSPFAVAAERSFSALSHATGSSRLQASIDALPMRDRSVDAALCCEVLEHLPPPVYELALRELARVADRHVVITVPNREVRRRSDLTCPSCGCRYNRGRHLRSFTPVDLIDLLPGFRLSDTKETGPRQPMYPRVLRTSLERLGILPILGSPTCPQCGMGYMPRNATSKTGYGDTTADSSDRYRALRRFGPKQRRPYWLCALYSRDSVNR